MYVGHINLAESFNGAGEHFVRLIESLQQRSVHQYVIVRNIALAKRLDLVEGVTVGPVVRSPITAYYLMPTVDVVHTHDKRASAAGLLLTLTRGVPFVITRHVSIGNNGNPLYQAVQNRAAGFIEENQIGADEHLRVYRQATSGSRVPKLVL